MQYSLKCLMIFLFNSAQLILVKGHDPFGEGWEKDCQYKYLVVYQAPSLGYPASLHSSSF